MRERERQRERERDREREIERERESGHLSIADLVYLARARRIAVNREPFRSTPRLGISKFAAPVRFANDSNIACSSDGVDMGLPFCRRKDTTLKINNNCMVHPINPEP